LRHRLRSEVQTTHAHPDVSLSRPAPAGRAPSGRRQGRLRASKPARARAPQQVVRDLPPELLGRKQRFLDALGPQGIAVYLRDAGSLHTSPFLCEEPLPSRTTEGGEARPARI
jgi:hypothetical protein